MDTFTPQQRLEHLHQAIQRGGMLYNELLATRIALNSLRAAVGSEGSKAAARILDLADRLTDMDVGRLTLVQQGPTEAETAWKERPC